MWKDFAWIRSSVVAVETGRGAYRRGRRGMLEFDFTRGRVWLDMLPARVVGTV